jgi:DNA-binding transcriptional LysR family regulator
MLAVSLPGDPHGFVDEALAKRGLSRRIELTVPNFMMALALIAETDLMAALPKHLVATHAARFGVVSVKSPLPPRRDPICAVASKAALMDAGVAWLLAALKDTQTSNHDRRAKRA